MNKEDVKKFFDGNYISYGTIIKENLCGYKLNEKIEILNEIKDELISELEEEQNEQTERRLKSVNYYISVYKFRLKLEQEQEQQEKYNITYFI